MTPFMGIFLDLYGQRVTFCMFAIQIAQVNDNLTMLGHLSTHIRYHVFDIDACFEILVDGSRVR